MSNAYLSVFQVKFQGDVAGAWCALDDDKSGYITLAEIDGYAHTTLVADRGPSRGNASGPRAVSDPICF